MGAIFNCTVELGCAACHVVARCAISQRKPQNSGSHTGGKPKTPDPARAGIVRDAFALYVTASYTPDSLALEMYGRGATSRRGRPISRTTWAYMLKNRFYAGELQLPGTKDVLPGIHEPLVSIETFERVQVLLRRRRRPRFAVRHHFGYRGLLRCACGKPMIGEHQKGHVYYRCHRCPGMCLREERVPEMLDRGLFAIFGGGCAENPEDLSRTSRFESNQGCAQN
jgi:hypothetical protein